MNNIDQTQQKETSRAKKHQELRDALAPFEDDLISKLPSADQIINDALLRQKKPKKLIKQALSIALLGTVGALIYTNPAYHQQTITTSIGETKDMLLEDGSQIQLNTNTKLHISYHLLSRKIDLQQGEATFHVKHNLWRPVMPWLERSFNVYIDDVRIEDIGTVFNVHRLSKQDIRIAVVEGKVRAYSTNKQKVDIETGQQLYIKNGLHENLEFTNVDQVIAWQKGYLYFNDQPLNLVLEELNRYGAMPVKLHEPSIGEIRISGQVNLNDRQQFIRALPSFAPVKLSHKQDEQTWIDKK